MVEPRCVSTLSNKQVGLEKSKERSRFVALSFAMLSWPAAKDYAKGCVSKLVYMLID